MKKNVECTRKHSSEDQLAPPRPSPKTRRMLEDPMTRQTEEVGWIKTRPLMKVVEKYGLPPYYEGCKAGIPAELEVVVAWAICWGYRTSSANSHERYEDLSHGMNLVVCQPLTDVWARLGSQRMLHPSDLELPSSRKTNPLLTTDTQRRQYKELIKDFYDDNSWLLGGNSGNIRPRSCISRPFELFDQFYKATHGLRGIIHGDWEIQVGRVMGLAEDLCEKWVDYSKEWT